MSYCIYQLNVLGALSDCMPQEAPDGLELFMCSEFSVIPDIGTLVDKTTIKLNLPNYNINKMLSQIFINSLKLSQTYKNKIWIFIQKL